MELVEYARAPLSHYWRLPRLARAWRGIALLRNAIASWSGYALWFRKIGMNCCSFIKGFGFTSRHFTLRCECDKF